MELYQPDVQYHNFSKQRYLGFAELCDYVRNNLPRPARWSTGAYRPHPHRRRTAFIQQRISLQGTGGGLLAFRTGEAITVRNGLIWRIHEYAAMMREERGQQISLRARTQDKH